jgi:DNA polymerase I
MAMLNASPETIVSDSFEGKAARADNGVSFRQDEQGVLAALVEDAIGLKEEYAEKRDAAETDEEFEKWAEKYASAKTITNSIYGVAGWERFFLYEERVAEAVTLTGQAVIKRTEEHVENVGFSVIYGDTDSVYIKMDDEWSRDRCLLEAEALCGKLNNEIYPEFAAEHGLDRDDNLWFIKTEAYMRRFFQAGRKKRYAYLATWKDGRELDEPDFSVSGFASKRSDSAALTKETEERVLRAILEGEADTVGTIIFEAAQEIQRKRPEWERIGIPGGMNNKIDPERAGQDGYYAFSSDGNYPQDAHPRAVWNSNKILDVNIGSGDKPMRVYLEPREFEAVGRTIDVIAFIDGAQLSAIEDRIAVDVPRMTEVLLTRPLRRICNAVDVDVHAAVKGQTQTGLGAFS